MDKELVDRVVKLAEQVAALAEICRNNTGNLGRCIDLITKLNNENQNLHDRVSNLENNMLTISQNLERQALNATT